MVTVKEELAAQEALRERERQHKKTVWRKTKNGRKSSEESLANNDRLKEQQEKLLQEKDKLWRITGTEIERLKEKIRQQKEREDRTQSQINWQLKQKTDDFEKVYRDLKQLEAKHKKLGSDFEQQQEKLK